MYPLADIVVLGGEEQVAGGDVHPHRVGGHHLLPHTLHCTPSGVCDCTDTV